MMGTAALFLLISVFQNSVAELLHVFLLVCVTIAVVLLTAALVLTLLTVL